VSVTKPQIRMSRVELLAALEACRSWARKTDRENLREHRAAEKAALKKFHDACREALKWDYETAKGKTQYRDRPHLDTLSCPISQEARLDALIAPVKLSKQTTYTISNDGALRGVYEFLTRDVNDRKDVCA
jgi:hypothetical protein